jgi:adenylate cyclase
VLDRSGRLVAYPGIGRDQEALLDSHRAEVVVIFCDLRGFTRFAGVAAPDEVMGLLQEYYEALGVIITRYEATLTCFMGDGVMLLLNAPVPCPDPALRGVRMAVEMQEAVQALVKSWRARGHSVASGWGSPKARPRSAALATRAAATIPRSAMS